MKGDFSVWEKKTNTNYNGVLHQQGRVLLDRDWNDQTRITGDWQSHAARDVVGTNVAAVPAGEPLAFKVVGAQLVPGIGGDTVKIDIRPGRIWADGFMAFLAGETTVRHTAEYLRAPGTAIEPGTRDAVILELWQESINGYQIPGELIEPALGGPDTTERLSTSMAFKLLRLGPGGSCDNIQARLEDDLGSRGRLKVSLKSAASDTGDCPMAESGGYSGFEHFLYRIEMARVSDGSAPMFKWSRFNGGLVGRGRFSAAEKKVFITANMQAIITSGLPGFYLEAVEFDDALGNWQTTYGAKVTLGDNNELVLPDIGSQLFGEVPLADRTVFFRLWDNIEYIADYPKVTTTTGRPKMLRDGIYLEFTESDFSGSRPGDYWIFKVRAGLRNEETLLNDEPPQGICYHRVPLAILSWHGASTITEEHIRDCRRIFRPLTRQKACCSYTVGPEGDVATIQEAVDRLPWWGGEICLLPGIHRSHTLIIDKFNIRIRGCHLRTLVLPAVTGEPLFVVENSWFTVIEQMFLATFGGIAVDMKGGGWNEVADNAIFAYQHAVRVVPQPRVVRGVQRSVNAFHVLIRDNVIRMLDKVGGDVALYCIAEEGLIEGNNIAVVPYGSVSPSGENPDEEDPADECVEAESIEADVQYVQYYLNNVWQTNFLSMILANPFRALGGIQLGGNSWRITVRDNKIFGGDGNGITLGSGALLPEFDEGPLVEENVEHTVTVRSIYGIGAVLMDGQEVAGITVKFSGPATHIDTTEGDGIFSFGEGMLNGTYRVTVETPGYQIKEVIVGPRINDNIRQIVIEVDQVEIEEEATAPFAFLYDIKILGNTLSTVGLCGIGFPAHILRPQMNMASKSLNVNIHRQMGNPVVGLNITGNHIKNCLRKAATAILFLCRSRGLGGISLGLCEDLTIRENRIEDNGRDHRDPVCGIYATYAAQCDISDNLIINNGPLNAEADLNIIAGIRGGIVIRRALSITLAAVVKTTRPAAPKALEPMGPDLANVVRAAAALGGFALKVHDNLVKQPLGHALCVSALGPVSIANNQLVTDFVEPKTPRPLAGAVYLLNQGHPHYLNRIQKTLLPSGSVMFCNNRIRLSMANCWTSQTIISGDDIAYLGNHSDIMEEARPILFNALIGALTLRASDNRLQETITIPAFTALYNAVTGTKAAVSGISKESLEPKASLFSYGVFMNTTTNNQGNHCLFAVGVAQEPVDTDNQVLVVSPETCKKFQDILNSRSHLLLPGFLRLGGYSQ